MQFDKYNLKYAVFDEFKDDRIVHAFTTRHGGVSRTLRKIIDAWLRH